MNLELNYEGFEKYLAGELYGICPVGNHYLFKFDNGFGASVIKIKDCSYGNENDLWELAVIIWCNPDDYKLITMKDITGNNDDNDDVYGYLTDKEVRDLLKTIKELKRP